jgi:lipopolysaccharide transport system permease protein
VAAYFSEIWRLRYFWFSLVQADLRRRYRRSVLGMGWSLLEPIAMTVVLSVVFSQVFQQHLREFAPYLLCGLTFWNFISTSTMSGCQCFIEGESYIRQYPAPLAIYSLRMVLGSGFHFLLGFLVNLLFVWSLSGFANVPALLPCLLPAFFLYFVLAWSLATCMGLANVMFQDSQHLVDILLQALFYATPIIYPVDLLLKRGIARWVIYLNPFAAYLDLIRVPLLNNELPPAQSFLFAGATTLVFAAIAVFGLKRFEKNLIFYL